MVHILIITNLFSGFCDMECCNEHLRKKRRKNKKWERICDYCEDKSLYENYMKL
jgi:hypothetical protein